MWGPLQLWRSMILVYHPQFYRWENCAQRTWSDLYKAEHKALPGTRTLVPTCCPLILRSGRTSAVLLAEDLSTRICLGADSSRGVPGSTRAWNRGGAFGKDGGVLVSFHAHDHIPMRGCLKRSSENHSFSAFTGSDGVIRSTFSKCLCADFKMRLTCMCS